MGDLTRELVRFADKRAAPPKTPDYTGDTVGSLSVQGSPALVGDVVLIQGTGVTLVEDAAAKTVTISAQAPPPAPITRGIAFYLHGVLAVETGALSFVAPMALTIQEVRLSVNTAPTGADLLLDVNLNGVTIFTTQANRPKILAGALSGTSPAPDVTAVALGAKISLDVDQIGTTVAGSSLAVTIVCTG